MKNAERLIGGNPKGERVSSDFYPTPPDVTEALLRYLKLPGSIIWEPACGEGDISKVLSDHGHIVMSTDLRETGYGVGNVDFVKAGKCPCDWIITNPPFSLADEFIRTAYGNDVSFAFLLKSQFWHAKKRFSLFQEIPPSDILPLTWRPDFLFKNLCPDEKHYPLMDVMWCVWDKRKAGSITQYLPLERPVIEVRDG